jgi:hypothetical protein
MIVVMSVLVVARVRIGHRRGAVIVEDHVKMKPRDHASAHPAQPQREPAEPQLYHHAMKLGGEGLGVTAGVEERSAEHVSGEARARVEPGERHDSRLMRVA